MLLQFESVGRDMAELSVEEPECGHSIGFCIPEIFTKNCRQNLPENLPKGTEKWRSGAPRSNKIFSQNVSFPSHINCSKGSVISLIFYAVQSPYLSNTTKTVRYTQPFKLIGWTRFILISCGTIVILLTGKIFCKILGMIFRNIFCKVFCNIFGVNINLLNDHPVGEVELQHGVDGVEHLADVILGCIEIVVREVPKGRKSVSKFTISQLGSIIR